MNGGHGKAGGGGKHQNGIGNGVCSSSMVPASPSFRRKGGKVWYTERLVYLLIVAVFRRKGLLLFAPLLYISGMLLYMGSLSLDAVPERLGVRVAILRRAPPGSVYVSPKVFQRLWPDMQADGGNSSLAFSTAWHPKAGQTWKSCAHKKVTQTELPSSNGFLIIEANGGLNQQRLSICDAVAVASLLNATLVIPKFHLNSVWRDSSKFGDIFDEEYFTERLKTHIRIAKELPQDVFQQFDNNMSNILNLRVKAWSSKKYYIQKVLPKLLEFGAIRIAPFSSRLAHTVPSDIQGLRCLANYDALRFSSPIRTLAEKMVDRMLKNSSMNAGRYISVHLRFEKDMVAFSLCVYDGGKEEKHEMDEARERSWRGKFKRPHRILKPGSVRVNGKCPLTPLEVGMILRGMGFDNTTSLYVASGKIYKAEKYMAPLRQLFPRLETKETLASEEELAPFKSHSSRLAALDYTVCLLSEIFVSTQGGNFPHFMMGHRRYLYEGHARTLNPDKRRLVLALDNPRISWDRFKHHMQDILNRCNVKGIEMRKANASLYTFPMPDCMCRQEQL